MKKVHLYFCYVLWSLWIIGIGLMLSLSCIYDPNIAVIIVKILFIYALIVTPFSLIPIEPILFIIALIAEIPQWKKSSFLSVVLPFIVTIIIASIYFVMIGSV